MYIRSVRTACIRISILGRGYATSELVMMYLLPTSIFDQSYKSDQTVEGHVGYTHENQADFAAACVLLMCRSEWFLEGHAYQKLACLQSVQY